MNRDDKPVVINLHLPMDLSIWYRSINFHARTREVINALRFGVNYMESVNPDRLLEYMEKTNSRLDDQDETLHMLQLALLSIQSTTSKLISKVRPGPYRVTTKWYENATDGEFDETYVIERKTLAEGAKVHHYAFVAEFHEEELAHKVVEMLNSEVNQDA